MQDIQGLKYIISSHPNSLASIKTNKGYKVIYNPPNYTMEQDPIYLSLRLPINNDRLCYHITITPFTVLIK